MRKNLSEVIAPMIMKMAEMTDKATKIKLY